MASGYRVVVAEGGRAVPKEGHAQFFGFFGDCVDIGANFFVGNEESIGFLAGNCGNEKIHGKAMDAYRGEECWHLMNDCKVRPRDGRVGLSGNFRFLQGFDACESFGKGAGAARKVVVDVGRRAFDGNLGASEPGFLEGVRSRRIDQGAVGD